MHHTMDGLDMLDPTGSMTTLTPMSENPISSSHHQLHGSYHSMNHMMGHHHSGPLGSHSSGSNNCMYTICQLIARNKGETSPIRINLQLANCRAPRPPQFTPPGNGSSGGGGRSASGHGHRSQGIGGVCGALQAASDKIR